MSEELELKDLSLGDIVGKMITETVALERNTWRNPIPSVCGGDRRDHNNRIKIKYDNTMEELKGELYRREQLYLPKENSE